MTIQGPPGNNRNHPEPFKGNGNASRAHQVPFTTPLPVDHLLGKLFKYLMRCGHGARAVHARCGYSPKVTTCCLDSVNCEGNKTRLPRPNLFENGPPTGAI